MPGPFTYDDIPLPNDQLSVSQNDIRVNFASLKSLIDINHVDFNSVDAGKHNFIELPTAAPTKPTTANEVALYSNNGATSTVPELFFQRAGLPFNNGYAITEGTNANSGWCRLGSGLVMKWGFITVNPPANGPVNLNAIGPNYANVPYTILLTPVWTTAGSIATAFAVIGSPAPLAPSPAGFTINVYNPTNTPVPLNWMTLGT